MQKLKAAYASWFEQYKRIPKIHRHTLGQRVDSLFVECIESVNAAIFTPGAEKVPHVRTAIRKIDTVKILLLVLWETGSLDNKKYIAVSKGVEEIGKMLGGWNGQLAKQNSLGKRPGEK